MQKKIMILDDNKLFCETIMVTIKEAGYEVDSAHDQENGMLKIKADNFDVVLLDLQLNETSGLDLIPKIKLISPETMIIMITGHADIHTSIEAIKRGAYDYISKEVEHAEVLIRIEKALEKKQDTLELENLKKNIGDIYNYHNIIGNNEAMRDIYNLIETVSDTEVTVLIHGETGTGKELIAKAIHFSSSRKDAPFWAINCTAISEHLMESELFGHEQGAFTGALKKKPGKIELTNGGTLFLDEIGDMPISLQGKLLRFLEERTFERVGGTKILPADVRVICATNKKLEKMIAEGKFREDLYYRLNVVKMNIPPLRERIDDLPILVNHFIKCSNKKFGKQIENFSEQTMNVLAAYDWPGNIRELLNLIEKIVLISKNKIVSDKEVANYLNKAEIPTSSLDAALNLNAPYKNVREEMEKKYLTFLLKKHKGKVNLAAINAGLDKRAVYYKLKKYNVEY